MTYYEYQRSEQTENLLEDHAIGLYSRAYKEIELDQPLWTHHRIRQIFDRTYHHLSQLQTAINTAITQDLRHVLPEKKYEIRMKTVRQRRLETRYYQRGISGKRSKCPLSTTADFKCNETTNKPEQ